MDEPHTVLVVGATGNLGRRVTEALVRRGKRVRALVRPGTDAGALTNLGVEVVRGDLTKPSTLPPALAGVDALVTSAIGYSLRKPGDSLQAVDLEGNRNLVDAARKANVPRFVFTSILTCDQAPDVPHFWAKKVTEDRLEEAGVPFIALRPGAYFGGPMWTQQIASGSLMAMGPTNVPWTYIHVDDVADALARAVDEPRAVGKRIDLGSDRPVSLEDLVRLIRQETGMPIRIAPPPANRSWGGSRDSAAAGDRARDMRAMTEYFATGKYVADTRQQAELFPPVPTMEEAVRRVIAESRAAKPPS